jgi:predicted ATPase
MARNAKECARLRRIALSNLLSFGSEMEPLVLENLNILIGPNGAGKSNLVEAVALMRGAPGDIRSIVRRGGGTAEWIWKGGKGLPATIDFVMDNPKGNQPLRHVLSFREDAQGFRLEDERIENETA